MELKQLLMSFYDSGEAFDWFFLPQPLLDGRVPVDILISDGAGPLLKCLRCLDEGAYI